MIIRESYCRVDTRGYDQQGKLESHPVKMAYGVENGHLSFANRSAQSGFAGFSVALEDLYEILKETGVLNDHDGWAGIAPTAPQPETPVQKGPIRVR